jgi:hypothetical protein
MFLDITDKVHEHVTASIVTCILFFVCFICEHDIKYSHRRHDLNDDLEIVLDSIFADMRVICIRTELDFPKYIDSLVITIDPKGKYKLRTTILLP